MSDQLQEDAARFMEDIRARRRQCMEAAEGRDGRTLLWVASDLRMAAEAHLKSAGVAGKRIERKHLAEIADVLLERARCYEAMTARPATGGAGSGEAD